MISISELMRMGKEEMLRTYYSLSEEEREIIDRQAIELVAPLLMLCKNNGGTEGDIAKIYDYSAVWNNVLRKSDDDN